MLRIAVLLVTFFLVVISIIQVLPKESVHCETQGVYETHAPGGLYVAQLCVGLVTSSLLVVSESGRTVIPISGTLWQLPQWSNSGEKFTYSVKSRMAGAYVYTYFLFNAATSRREYLYRSILNIGSKWTEKEAVVFVSLDWNLYCYQYFELTADNALETAKTDNFQPNLLCSALTCTKVNYNSNNCT